MKIARIYLRVSTDEQDLTRQAAIEHTARAAGYYIAGVYREKASGARADRPELLRMIADFNDYFRSVSAERRRHPTDDLASVIANAVIDGEPISDIDAMGYYVTIAFAGHDTTSSSVAGAIWALAERPEELAEVRSNPALIPSLVDEAVRWTTPIHQFVRRGAVDCEVRGQNVRAGDWVVLLFPSGNRDEDVFQDPFDFRSDRSPSRQIGFGYGAHVCLGQHLARMEMSIFFEELLPRLTHIELAGRPTRMATNFVGGPKSLPVKFRMSH